jgi:hypothetical protein
MMSTRLDVLDLAGRLVATSAVVPDGSVWTAHYQRGTDIAMALRRLFRPAREW